MVQTAHRYAIAGLCLLGITLTGVAALIFDAVAGAVAGVAAGVCFALIFAVIWMVRPLWQRRAHPAGPARDDAGVAGSIRAGQAWCGPVHSVNSADDPRRSAPGTRDGPP